MTMPLGGHFSDGYDGGRGAGSPGLEAADERWRALTQAADKPHSILNQLAPSPIAANLSAPSLRDRLLPNGFQLANYGNGASQPTVETENYLHMNQH